MAAFRINRTNDAVFKAVFAKHPEITLALINAFFEFQGTELLTDIEFIDRERQNVVLAVHSLAGLDTAFPLPKIVRRS